MTNAVVRWLMAAVLASAGALAHATTLDYDAFIAGTKIGEAKVTVEVGTDSYLIQGRAHAVGFMDFITQWRTLFTATGSVGEGQPVVHEYSLIERARNKIKEIFLSDGTVTYTKNGRTRPPRTANGLDLLTALFVAQDCAIDQVHNGKDSYRLTLRDKVTVDDGAASLKCSFDVVDEDDEHMTAEVWLGTVGDLVVPLRVDLQGALEGSLRVSS